MSEPLANLLQHLLFPALGVIAFIVVYQRRSLEAAVFDEVPPRRTGIVLLDLFLGVWILLAGQIALIEWLKLLMIPLPGDYPAPTLRETAVSGLLGQLLTHVPIVLFTLWAAGRVPGGTRAFGLAARRPRREIAAGLLALLAALPMVLGASVIFMILSKLMGQEPPVVGHEMLKAMMESHDAVATALMVVSAVLVAPILEECVYRGLVQTSLLAVLGPRQRWTIIFLASGLFAFIHGGVATWQVLPGLFILGVILGWLYEKHGSLWPGIVLHMAFNWVNIGLAMLQETAAP